MTILIIELTIFASIISFFTYRAAQNEDPVIQLFGTITLFVIALISWIHVFVLWHNLLIK
jgi:hypothetical protein